MRANTLPTVAHDKNTALFLEDISGCQKDLERAAGEGRGWAYVCGGALYHTVRHHKIQ